jgi:phosphatidylinositol N-acetylglucosaminyltransferase subunit Q
MHPFSILTLGIFVAGYITARWDLIAQLYAVTIFAWDHGVVVSQQRINSWHTECARTDARFLQARAAKGFAILSVFFFLFLLPIERVASRESKLVRISRHATESDADHLVEASARR